MLIATPLFHLLELVPSSARSSSSAATPLPTQFKPLLDETLDKVKAVIQKVMPVEKKLSALEEAEFEDEGGEEGALEKEMLSQGTVLILTVSNATLTDYCDQQCKL